MTWCHDLCNKWCKTKDMKEQKLDRSQEATPVCDLSPPVEETLPPQGVTWWGQGSQWPNVEVEGHRWKKRNSASGRCISVSPSPKVHQWEYASSVHSWGEDLIRNWNPAEWENETASVSRYFYIKRRAGKRWREGERRGEREKRSFNLLILSLPIRSRIKQITQNAPLHTSVSLPISPF